MTAGYELRASARLAREQEVVTTLFYPDVSNRQWSSTQDALDFLGKLASEGFAGVVHKCSEGSYFQDPFWQPVRKWCQQNALPYIGYHYVTTDEPDMQAQTFIGNLGGLNAMLDWEENGGDLVNFWSVVHAFNSAGVNVQMAYAPQWYWRRQGGGDLSPFMKSGISLVSAAYPGGTGSALDIYAHSGGDTGEGWASYGNATPAGWQFTDKASIGGFVVDCNAYKGTYIQPLFGQSVATKRSPAHRRIA